jgi:hypothetical protein
VPEEGVEHRRACVLQAAQEAGSGGARAAYQLHDPEQDQQPGSEARGGEAGGGGVEGGGGQRPGARHDQRADAKAEAE